MCSCRYTKYTRAMERESKVGREGGRERERERERREEKEKAGQKRGRRIGPSHFTNFNMVI